MPVRQLLSILLLTAVAFAWTALSAPPLPENESAAKLFQDQINATLRGLQRLNAACKKNASTSIIKAEFKTLRLSYKKAAIFTEYYYPNESLDINGPDQKRTQDDNPDRIQEPHGLQVIERLIFSRDSIVGMQLIQQELKAMEETFLSFRDQPNLSFKFKKALVFDALRASMIKMIAKGITGFDSPIALLSMPEAAATMEGIAEILSVYPSGRQKNIQSLMRSAKEYLQKNSRFDSFDRLAFITEYANPIYELIGGATIAEKASLPVERRPLNPDARNIFSGNAFDVSFFSPNEQYNATSERIALGELIFYDSVLSLTNNRSCGSCHKPGQAFTDGLPKGLSVDEHTFIDRNTPTLWNAVLQARYFYDSRAATLENQLDIVVHDSKEMSGSLKEGMMKLKKNEKYLAMFREAYPSDKDPVTAYTIANAVSSYVRSLVSLNSRFDRYIRNESGSFTSDEKAGFNIFAGKAKCGTCHYIPLFNGLAPPEFTETESEVLGVPSNTDTLHARLDPDKGKYLFTRSSIHEYSFKTPTLRNIAITAPYMHNGVYKTLEEVMEFYNRGGGSGLKTAPETQTLPEEKLLLSKKEVFQVISFLHTLTDTSYRRPQ